MRQALLLPAAIGIILLVAGIPAWFVGFAITAIVAEGLGDAVMHRHNRVKEEARRSGRSGVSDPIKDNMAAVLAGTAAIIAFVLCIIEPRALFLVAPAAIGLWLIM